MNNPWLGNGKGPVLGAASILLVVGLSLIGKRLIQGTGNRDKGPESLTSGPLAIQDIASTEPSGKSPTSGVDAPPASVASRKSWDSLFHTAIGRFASARTFEESLAIYAGLRDRILSDSDPLAAAEAIASFLAGGKDAQTGLAFLVGNDGFLDTAPTLRTALLDFVAELDAAIALRLAREIMDAHTSADEFAVALRNLAWSPLAGSGRETEVARRFGELLDQQTWLGQPSTGFLEAFDAAVAVSDRSCILDLASVAGLEDTSGNPVRNGVNEAASLALDRIMLRSPGEVVALFEEDPSFLAHRPGQRATLLARLDLRKRDQYDRFRNYLNEPAPSPDELSYFSSLFPNTTYSYGHRLISRQETAPSITEMQETDRAFLRILSEAREDGSLPDSPALRTILTNLQSYVAEADAAARLPAESAPPIGEADPSPPARPRHPERTGAPGRVRILP